MRRIESSPNLFCYNKTVFGNRLSREDKLRASIYLVTFVAIESCCLLIFLWAWMESRDAPLSLIWREDPNAHQIVEKTPTPELLTTISLPWLSTLTQSPGLNLSSSPSPSPATTNPTELPSLGIHPPGKIIYTCFDGSYDQICLMNADGTNQRQLTEVPATNFYPSLSPDGEWVVFSSRRDGNFEIFLMDIRGQNLTQLTNNIGNLYAPEISPKNNRIVFSQENGGIQRIWVMKLDGTNARPLFEYAGSEIDPTWSPDGNHIAFASRIEGDTQLFTIDLENFEIRPVFHSRFVVGGRSSWSPDGEWLAFYAGPRDGHELFIVHRDGSNLIKLTDGGDNLGPCYSPDGEWLAFTSFRDGNNEIYVMRIADQAVFRLTINLETDWQPRWGR